MNQSLTTTKTGEMPEAQWPEMHALIAKTMNAIEVGVSGRALISSRSLPGATERRSLQARRDELQRGLQPSLAGRELAIDLAKRILKMFHAWPVVRMDEEKAAGVAKTYAAQLEHLPTWAVEGGIADCQHRNNPFPPSAGELRAACEARMRAFKAELAEITTLLDAEVYQQNSEEVRKRMLDGFQGLIDDFTKTHVMPRSKSVQEYRDAPDEDAERGLASLGASTDVSASPSLLKTLERAI